ncbi:hypothetical protein N9948_00255 [bacterium]|nr:hypothetical protein [bacterium]
MRIVPTEEELAEHDVPTEEEMEEILEELVARGEAVKEWSEERGEWLYSKPLSPAMQVLKKLFF